MATQTITKTVKTTKATIKKRGLASASPSTEKRSPGRPKGSTDTKPRKPRSDKGKKRGAYKKRS